MTRWIGMVRENSFSPRFRISMRPCTLYNVSLGPTVCWSVASNVILKRKKWRIWSAEMALEGVDIIKKGEVGWSVWLVGLRWKSSVHFSHWLSAPEDASLTDGPSLFNGEITVDFLSLVQCIAIGLTRSKNKWATYEGGTIYPLVKLNPNAGLTCYYRSNELKYESIQVDSKRYALLPFPAQGHPLCGWLYPEFVGCDVVGSDVVGCTLT